MIHSYTGNSLLADVSYDAFLYSEATTTGAHDYEIMIWLSALGGAEPIGYGSSVTSVVIGDYTWDLYEGTNTEGSNTWTVFSFVAPTEIKNFSGISMTFSPISLTTTACRRVNIFRLLGLARRHSLVPMRGLLFHLILSVSTRDYDERKDLRFSNHFGCME